MSRSTHVGRVGALAVALGIGLALTSTPAIAWADETGETTSAVGSEPQTVARPSTTRDDPAEKPATTLRKSRKAARAEDEAPASKRHLRYSERAERPTPAHDRVEPQTEREQAPERELVTPVQPRVVAPRHTSISIPEPVALQAPVPRTETAVPARTPVVRTVLSAVSDFFASKEGTVHSPAPRCSGA